MMSNIPTYDKIWEYARNFVENTGNSPTTFNLMFMIKNNFYGWYDESTYPTVRKMCDDIVLEFDKSERQN